MGIRVIECKHTKNMDASPDCVFMCIYVCETVTYLAHLIYLKAFIIVFSFKCHGDYYWLCYWIYYDYPGLWNGYRFDWHFSMLLFKNSLLNPVCVSCGDLVIVACKVL